MTIVPATIKDIVMQLVDDLEPAFTTGHISTKKQLIKTLIEPYQKAFLIFRGPVVNYWVVLDECPGDKEDGYLVIYDMERERFGLATKTCSLKPSAGFLVGFYNSFSDALENM